VFKRSQFRTLWIEDISLKGHQRNVLGARLPRLGCGFLSVPKVAGEKRRNVMATGWSTVVVKTDEYLIGITVQ
jgi:hypothetical protein